MANLIKKNLKITVNGNKSTLDEDLYLFRNDRNIDLIFSVTNFKFDFVSNTTTEEDLIEIINPSYALIRIKKPDCELEGHTIEYTSDLLPIINYKVVFSIDEDFINEECEVGTYDLQISLYDAVGIGRATIPPVQFEVLEPIFEGDAELDELLGQIDFSQTDFTEIPDAQGLEEQVNGRDELIEEGSGLYEWQAGDWITANRMNAIHNTLIRLDEELTEAGIGEVEARDVSYDSNQFTNVQDALDYLLYVPLSVSSFSIVLNRVTYNGNVTVERGQTFSSCTLNWTYNKSISSITSQSLRLPNSSTINVGTSLTYTYSNSISSNVSFTITGNDERQSASRSIYINYYNRIYWGVSSSITYNDTFISGLSNNVLSDSIGRTITVTANEGQYIYYAFPSRLGTPVFKVGGFEGGFEEVANISFTNGSGFTEVYTIYKSINANLGETTIEISS